MRPLRDWAWKKLPDDDIRAQGEAMRKEEIKEYKNILASFTGLEDYIKSGKKTSDFIREYDSLGWEMRPWEFHFTKFHYDLEHAPRTKEGLIDLASEASSDIDGYYATKLPDSIISTFALPIVDEKYKNWSFAISFGDNDFGTYMEKIGEIIGGEYLEELKGIYSQICLFEDCEREAGDMCAKRLDKYLLESNIIPQINNLIPGIYNLIQFVHFGRDIDDVEAERIQDYLRVEDHRIKIGTKEEVEKWINNTLYPDADVLVVSIVNGGRDLRVRVV